MTNKRYNRHFRESGNDYLARRYPEGHNRHFRESGNDYLARRYPEGHNRHFRESGNPYGIDRTRMRTGAGRTVG